MNWYAAHIVMFAEFKSAEQDRFPVWENIVLIAAADEEEAFAKAERHGRAAEGDDGGSFRWGKHPARWVFAGVRKLTECDSVFQKSSDGVELSYTEFELDSRVAVEKLVAGEPVRARLNDRYRPTEKRENASKLAKRRPA